MSFSLTDLKKFVPEKLSARTNGAPRRASLSQIASGITSWFAERESREQYLMGAALFVLLFIIVDMIATSIGEVFEEQESRLSAIESDLRTASSQLAEFNQLEAKRLLAQQQFAQAGAQSAMLAHLESVIERKAKIESRFEINRGSENAIGNQFTRLSFTVIFRQITPEELSQFLKELSSDEEKPAIISKVNLTSRGNSLRAEVSLDLVARRS
ncbi:type II secretion system protein M [bacterium]|nr:type II secretion system protein M [bacterium]